MLFRSAWSVLQQEGVIEVQDEASRKTIFAQCYQTFDEFDDAQSLSAKWSRVREIRAQVQKDLEVLRADGKIGASLQAEVQIECGASDAQILASLGEQLKFVLIVSSASVTSVAGDEMRVLARASEHAKCARCWHYVPDIGQDPDHPDICSRCVSNLAEASGG